MGRPPKHERDVVAAFSVPAGKLFAKIADGVGRRAGVELRGIDRLPDGGALLIANDAFGIWDVVFVTARLRQTTDRPVFVLGAHRSATLPVLRGFAQALGAIDGTPENADAVLRARELLLVLPGGLHRYYGFVQAALRNQAPLVPLACLGGDELFDLVGDPFSRGVWGARLPLPRALDFLPLPHRAHKRFAIGDPIVVRGRQDESDPRFLRSMRREVEGALRDLIEEDLAGRHAGRMTSLDGHAIGFVRRLLARGV
jgi:1-acyl-sn-glycerol-3-phosphate acyltransferase